MRTISATDAARGFAEVMNRVRYQGEQFEVVRNGERIARIVPTNPARALTARELGDLVAALPALDPAFRLDLLAARAGTLREGF